MESNKKIAFLGASVTAQTFSRDTGEVIGYVEAFREKYEKRFGFSQTKSFSYPGNRLSGAGILRVSDLIAYQPAVAILELVVEDEGRGSDYDDRHLSHTYFSLIEQNILPITIAFPKKQKREPTSLKNYNIIKNFCDRYNFPLLTVSIPEDISLASIYRDAAHTNNMGAKLYAGFVSEALDRFGDFDFSKSRLPTAPFKFCVSKLEQSPTSDFLKIAVKSNGLQNSRLGYFELIQQQKIGRYSPVLEISLKKADHVLQSQKKSVWDPYCHYERKSYVKLAEFKKDYLDFDQLTVTVSTELPKYQKCRRKSDYTADKGRRFMRPLSAVYSVSNQPINLSVTDVTSCT